MPAMDKINRGRAVFERLAGDVDVERADLLEATGKAYWTPDPNVPGYVALIGKYDGELYVEVWWAKKELTVHESLAKSAGST